MFCKIRKAHEGFLIDMSRRGRLYIMRQVKEGRGKNAKTVDRMFKREISKCKCDPSATFNFCVCFTMDAAISALHGGKLYVRVNS